MMGALGTRGRVGLGPDGAVSSEDVPDSQAGGCNWINETCRTEPFQCMLVLFGLMEKSGSCFDVGTGCLRK